MRFDLHTHSTASDGTLSPADLVHYAHDAGLAAIALTDHDSVDGIPEALTTASRLNAGGSQLLVIPGVELSAVHSGRDVHILGYFVDHTHPGLLTRLRDLRTARGNRARAIVTSLRAAGYEIELDEVLALSDGGAVGRSHVARALVGRGHAADVSDAFKRLLGRGQPFYLTKDVRTPAEVLRTVLDAGGLPVLAHPGVTGVDDLIGALVDEGLVGIEAYHSEHDHEQEERYSALAAQYGLLITGGTDFHGPDAPNPPLGSIAMPSDLLERLLHAGGRGVLHSSGDD